MNTTEASFPLSPLQQGMLSLHLYAPDSGVYVQQLVGILAESLDVPRFERAWRTVIERHPALRTAFRWQAVSEPVQEVWRTVNLVIEQEDLRALPASQRDARLEEFLEQDRRRGFDLAEAPQMRIRLFRPQDEEFWMVWSSHHAMMDGQSRLLILRELFLLYESYGDGREVAHTPERSYSDYVAWIAEQDLSEAKTFWKALLDGVSSATALSLAPPAHSEKKGIPGEQETRLPLHATSKLREFARQHDLTLNTLVLGAWAILLSRYGGEEDVVFGATRACRRSLPGAQSMVGLLINTLPVRVKLPPNAQLTEWLGKLRQDQVEVRKFERTPLSKIQEWSALPGGTPLFESIVVFENNELNTTLRSGGEEWKKRSFRLLQKTNFPLTLTAYGEAELLLRLAYDRQRFDDAEIARMLGHLATVLEAICSDPDRLIRETPLVTESEHRQLLYEWNQTDREYPRTRTVHGLFEEQVERTPEVTAVVFGEERLTYRQLNERANRLAGYLSKRGVGPGDLVGLCVERSMEMIVGVLGILKAGGGYVPLDPGYPSDRLAFMLMDSGARVVLAQRETVSALPKADIEPVLLDDHWPAIAAENEASQNRNPGPDDVAYVIYTSGSTGKPKGVFITHRSVVNLLTSMARVPGITENDVLLAVTTLSFDIAALELYLPLVTGARLVIAPRSVAMDAGLLAERIERLGITIMQATPATWTMLLGSGWAGNPRLKILCGGEALAPDLARALFERAGSVWNLYGPTETTIWSAVHRVRDEAGAVPIGEPIANTQMYVLDPHLRPQPIGVPGELYIGGIGVARGYLNRPDLTAEKFISDPFRTGGASKLYRTGDLVRRRSDGQIEFLGRKDDQVKVRGFRIELGEIESALRNHSNVGAAAVVARGGSGGQTLLVAYIVTRNGESLSVTELRDFLKVTLPDYMVPSAFLFLHALPLTPNGKLDRRSLPPPDQQRPKLDGVFLAPRNPVEQTVAEIWAHILGLENVGVDDDFFELGGHSLLAIQVVSRIRDAFGIELPLRELFDSSTVRALSEVLEKSKASGSIPEGPALIALDRGSRLLKYTLLLAWARELFGGGDLDGVLTSGSICFDPSLFEIFAPLA